MSAPYIRPGRALVEAEDAGHVDQREEVDDAEPAAAAAERRGQVQPAAGRGRGGSARTPTGPSRSRRAAARSVPRSRTNSRIRIADRDGRQPEDDRRAAPADRGDQRHADERDDDGPDVAAGDMGADREPAPLGRELLGQQAVADRMLGRPADPRRDVRDGVRHEARRERRSARTRHRTGSRRSRAAGGARRPGSARRS